MQTIIIQHENDKTNHSLEGVMQKKMSSSNSWIIGLLKIAKIFIGQRHFQ